MFTSLIHYIVDPAGVVEHISAVQKLFHSLKQDNIFGVHYSVFLLGENVFIHVVECQKEGCIDNLNQRPDVIEFLKGMSNRLVEEPIPIYVKNIAVLNQGPFNNSESVL
jgi:hypothetical protein